MTANCFPHTLPDEPFHPPVRALHASDPLLRDVHAAPPRLRFRAASPYNKCWHPSPPLPGAACLALFPDMSFCVVCWRSFTLNSDKLAANTTTPHAPPGGNVTVALVGGSVILGTGAVRGEPSVEAWLGDWFGQVSATPGQGSATGHVKVRSRAALQALAPQFDRPRCNEGGSLPRGDALETICARLKAHVFHPQKYMKRPLKGIAWNVGLHCDCIAVCLAVCSAGTQRTSDY